MGVVLTNLDLEHVLFYSILLVVATACVSCILYRLGAALKGLPVQKVETKAGSVEFVSPQDRMAYHTIELDTTDPGISTKDWSHHAYFMLLVSLRDKGVKVYCRSNVKAQFINEYMKIYSGIIYSEFLTWVQGVAYRNGEGLEQITSVMSEIEGKAQNILRSSKIPIKYCDTVRYVQIPLFLIERFVEHYTFSQTACFDTLNMSLDSKFYQGWEECLACILAQMYTIASANFSGMNSAIKTLNGELDTYFDEYLQNLTIVK